MWSKARPLLVFALFAVGGGCSSKYGLSPFSVGESDAAARDGGAVRVTVDTGTSGTKGDLAPDTGLAPTEADAPASVVEADAAADTARAADGTRATDSASPCATCGVDAPMDTGRDSASTADSAGSPCTTCALDARPVDPAKADSARAIDGAATTCSSCGADAPVYDAAPDRRGADGDESDSLLCPSGTSCCDGTDPHCDGTELPVGNTTNPGQFVVSADGRTVTDTITHLVWQRGDTGAQPGFTGGTTATWTEAHAYCADLSLGGFTDWRLPHVKELRTIVDFSQDPVALDPVAFPHDSHGSVVWTVDPSAESVNYVWGLLLGNGSYTAFRRVDTHGVRCVRGSHCAPTTRFVVEGGRVRDMLTNRVWQRDGAGTRTGCTGTDARTCTWHEAAAYCEALVLDGFDDFRLPTAKEMDSLVDFTVPPMGPTIDTIAFPDTPVDPIDDAFWTSALYQNGAWRTYFYNGQSLGHPLDHYARVRCVR